MYQVCTFKNCINLKNVHQILNIFEENLKQGYYHVDISNYKFNQYLNITSTYSYIKFKFYNSFMVIFWHDTQTVSVQTLSIKYLNILPLDQHSFSFLKIKHKISTHTVTHTPYKEN